jgi:hypothetical protein
MQQFASSKYLVRFQCHCAFCALHSDMSSLRSRSLIERKVNSNLCHVHIQESDQSQIRLYK